MSISERDIDEFLTKIEFKRSYPDLLIDLIHKSRNLAGELYSYYKHLDDIINRNLDLIRNYISICDVNISYENPIGSVDGSMVTLQGIGNKWFVVYGVSKVIFPKGILSFSKPEINVSVHTEFLGENDPTVIKRVAVLRMMYGESKAMRLLIHEKIRDGLIFIDGPFIDPPNIHDEEYIKFRVENFRHASKLGNEIIGIVKRYSSKIFSGVLSEEIPTLQTYNDRFLIPYTFNKIRTSEEISENSSLYTKPIPLRKEFEIAIKPDVFDFYENLLHEDMSYRLYGFYFQHIWGSRAIKVEFLARSENEAAVKAEKIASILRATTVPGTYLPLPIILAHETSLIRKRVAKVILSNALAQFVVDVSDYGFIYDLITYE